MDWVREAGKSSKNKSPCVGQECGQMGRVTVTAGCMNQMVILGATGSSPNPWQHCPLNFPNTLSSFPPQGLHPCSSSCLGWFSPDLCIVDSLSFKGISLKEASLTTNLCFPSLLPDFVYFIALNTLWNSLVYYLLPTARIQALWEQRLCISYLPFYLQFQNSAWA